MKRLKIFICLLLSSLLLFSTPVYAYYDQRTGIEYNDVMAPLYFEASLPNLSNISGDMCVYVIRSTPEELMKLYIQEGVRIYVTQSVPKSERIASDNANINIYDGRAFSAKVKTDSSGKVIKVTSPVEIYIYSDVTRVDTYIHECGHALDYLAAYLTGYYSGNHPISNSSEWKTLYANYAATMATFDKSAAINMYDPNEGFAEAYRLYFSYPQQLLSSCPDVYYFVADQIAKYTAYNRE